MHSTCPTCQQPRVEGVYCPSCDESNVPIETDSAPSMTRWPIIIAVVIALIAAMPIISDLLLGNRP